MTKNITTPRILAVYVLLVAALLVSGCTATPSSVMGAPAAAQAGSWTEISIDEAAAKRDAGAFILDVRQPEEWQEGHIPGATLIPLGELEGRLSEIPQGQEVVVYCRSGNRSRTGAEILAKNGFNPVSSMAGGIKEWQAAGYPTEAEQ
jgi:rhodanese-related sulfurtransferase